MKRRIAPVPRKQPDNLFPFVVPWDSKPEGIADFSFLLHKPAGSKGFVQSRGGHFYAGSKRIRFWGVNMVAGACFQRKSNIEKIAERIARAGFNVVRFHHMDAIWSNPSLIHYAAGNSRRFNPEALDAFDYFVAQLKLRGVYTNINLLVNRVFKSADGLPAEVDSVPDPKDQHVIGFFYEPMLNLQKEFARLLLTHRNPYTKLTYAEDPAVAFVEINNENGLIHGWMGGAVDRMPAIFQDDLRRQWNEWLRAKYAGTQAVREAWGEWNIPTGTEMLRNSDFRENGQHWILEQHDDAQAAITTVPDAPSGYARSLQLSVSREGGQSWHVQFHQPELRVRVGQLYTLSFWAKSGSSRNISVSIAQAHSPWQQLGFYRSVSLTTEWQRFEYSFFLSQANENARVLFSEMGSKRGTVWIAGVSLKEGGQARVIRDGENLEAGNLSIVLRNAEGAQSESQQKDWLRFLWDTESRYWRAMDDYLKQDLKVKAIIFGTIVGCSTPNLMAAFDCVDTHGYWQHPEFPGKGWDPENWFVRNLPMVNHRGGTVGWLSVKRVKGKPLTVTEYNHPAPIFYGAEGALLIAAYGAFQDWDGIYLFAYSHRGENETDLRRIPNFFDIDQHPTKWTTMCACAALFLRADVKHAKRRLTVTLSKEQEISALRHSGAWRLVDGTDRGLKPEHALVHGLEVDVTGENDRNSPLPRVDTGGSRLDADTGELTWDWSVPNKGIVLIKSPVSKAVIGFGTGRRFDLNDGVVVEPGVSHRDWSVITLTVRAGALQPGSASKLTRLLITATGFAQNSGWNLQELSDNRLTVGNQWGQPPSLVEGISAKITLPLPAAKTKVWSLDPLGKRQSQVKVHANSNRQAVIELGHQFQTLWYEVECRG